MADQQKNMDKKGLAKPFTNAIRTGSRFADYLPIPGIGDISAAGLTALAGGVDTVACMLQGDMQGAKRELMAGTAETAVAALPFAEYASFVGFDARKTARGVVTNKFNEISGAAAPAPAQTGPVSGTAPA